jgi:23S rRNA (uracil1939-C5)-methyltransferase
MTNIKTLLDKKKDSHVAFVHSLSHDGRGIATIQQMTTFITDSLPNESVSYNITHRHTRYHEAQATHILIPSSDRVAPGCQHFGICGGCSLQHMNPKTQLELKQNTLLEQLKHFGQTAPREILPPIQGESYYYRRKARLGVKYVHKKNKILIGFREKSSRYLADLHDCPILSEKLSHQLPHLAELIRSLSIYLAIPQIEIAMGDTDCALVFRHLQALTNEDQQKLIQLGKQNNFHIYLQPHSPTSLIKLWPQDHHHRLIYTLPDWSLTMAFHPLDFTQINLEMNRKMLKQALNLLELTSNENILDLFCGIGNFSLPLALYGGHVTGIEGAMQMVLRAKDNARTNQIQNIDFYETNLEQPIQNMKWVQTPYDKLLLDPPRTGAKAILPYVKHWRPKRILYISCNPATLARDAHDLVHQQGYILTKAGIMDMFPHTSHVEAMAVFDKS